MDEAQRRALAGESGYDVANGAVADIAQLDESDQSAASGSAPTYWMDISDLMDSPWVNRNEVSEPKKPWRPSGWIVLGALLLVALCLRALVGANRYGNASDQLRLELVFSTVVTVIVSVAVIVLIIYVGERPGHVRMQRATQFLGPDQEVWAVRVDSRSRAVLGTISRADTRRLVKPGLYFVVAFDTTGMRIVASTKEPSPGYLVRRENIRRVRSLEYRLSHGRSETVAVTFDRDGKHLELPLVLVEWRFISHHPIGRGRRAEVIERLEGLWGLDPALVR